MSGDCVVTATERVGQEVVRECVDALVEELSAWAFQREKVLAKLDLRGARRARSVQLSIAHTSRLAAHELDLEGLDEDDDQ